MSSLTVLAMSAGKNMHKHKGILILRVEFLKSNNSTKQVQMIIMVPDHLKKKKKKELQL